MQCIFLYGVLFGGGVFVFFSYFSTLLVMGRSGFIQSDVAILEEIFQWNRELWGGVLVWISMGDLD